MHHYKRSKKVKEWKEAASQAYIEAAFGEMPPSFIRVKIPFTVRRIRDPHNYCGTVVKAVVDAIVTAGGWPDDNPEYVTHIEPILYLGDKVVVDLWHRMGETPPPIN